MGATAVLVPPDHPRGHGARPALRLVDREVGCQARRRGAGPNVAVMAAAVATIVLLLGLLEGVASPPGAAVPPPASTAPLRPGTVHVVQPGDTMWSLARRVAAGGDVRALVDRLVTAHGGSSLKPGDRIVLPHG